MSTITSPRPSSAAASTPTSSRRPSLDSAHSPSPSRQPSHHPPPRPKNRLALRDYYNLPPSSGTTSSSSLTVVPPSNASSSNTELFEEQEDIPASALDEKDFNAESYVQGLLENDGLEGVLGKGGKVVNEIRALDASRKALVYDNYSKLILATDTIRSMRTSMDPLQAGTSTLQPAVGHIAATASALSSATASRSKGSDGADQAQRQRMRKRQWKAAQGSERWKSPAEFVRWVTEAPDRLREMGDAGDEEGVRLARREWAEVKTALDVWSEKGIRGVDETRRRCEAVVSGLDRGKEGEE